MKKFTSLVLLACILLSLLTISEALPPSSSPEKRTNTCMYKRNVLGKRTNAKKCPCALAEAIFDSGPVNGLVVYAQDECGSTTITGQFNKGFEDPNKNFTFQIVDKCGRVLRDLTSSLGIQFSDGGTKAFTTKLHDLNLNCDENGILNQGSSSSKRTCYSKRQDPNAPTQDPNAPTQDPNQSSTGMRINSDGEFYAQAQLNSI